MQLVCPSGVNILSYIRSRGLTMDAPCAGNGSCGKCRIRILAATKAPRISAEEKSYFTKEELNKHWRLACRQKTEGPVRILIPDKEVRPVSEAGLVCEAEFAGEAGSGYEAYSCSAASVKTEGEKLRYNDPETAAYCPKKDLKDQSAASKGRGREKLGLALDLGTSTLVMSLLDLKCGVRLASESRLNSQRIHGFDLLSRINASNEGHLSELTDLVRRDIVEMARSLLNAYLPSRYDCIPAAEHSLHTAGFQAAEHSLHPDDRQFPAPEIRMMIAGNTCMLHLLEGLSCRSLGIYPYKPLTLGGEKKSWSELFGSPLVAPGTAEAKIGPVDIVRGISSFVGADITAGIYALDLDIKKENSFLLDLGTNGEMALIKDGEIYCSSAAAGPAFEGGCLSCGTGSIAGAVSSMDEYFRYRTIGDREPVGFCGTGAIEASFALLKTGLMDRTGRLDGSIATRGFRLPGHEQIGISQDDIRQIQLAKGAVRAGMEILLKKAGIGYDEIDRLYLSGSFGTYLDPWKAAGIGLLPGELAGRSIAAGNTSLKGAEKSLIQNDSQGRIRSIAERAHETELACEEDFEKLFIRYMDFPG